MQTIARRAFATAPSLGLALAFLLLGACSGSGAAGPDGGAPADDAGHSDGAAVAETVGAPDAAPDGARDGATVSDAALDTVADAVRDAVTHDSSDDARDSTPDSTGDSTGDVAADAGAPWAPPFDPTVCGAPPHAWLPPDAVGGVVTWEPTPLFASLTAAQVAALIEAAGQPAPPIPYGVRNYRLRYVSQDRGEATEATALVSVPVGTPAGAAVPVVAYLHGATGYMDECAPSRDAGEGALPGTVLASLGYLTVAPDCLGMRGFGAPSPPGTIHSYLVAEATGIGSWDAVRAALVATAADETLATGDPERVALVGGSQGGQAVFAMDRYWRHYAPEFGVVGGVALAPPTDLLGLAVWIMETGAAEVPTAARSLVAALGALHAWYGGDADLADVLTDEEPLPLASTVSDWMASGCAVPDGWGALAAADAVFPAAFRDALVEGRLDDAAPWTCYLAENSFARTSAPRASDAPILLATGEVDDLVDAAVERADAQALCEQGYALEFVECAGTGHSVAGLEMVFYVLDWLEDRFAGEPLPPERACTFGPPVDCTAL